MAKQLNQINSMPRVSAVFSGWQSQVCLVVRTQVVADGIVTPTDVEVRFKGIIQPMAAEQLQHIPEADRSLRHLQIHAVAGSLNLKNNDNIIYDGVEYEVEGVLDYTLNGYVEYHVKESYLGN